MDEKARKVCLLGAGIVQNLKIVVENCTILCIVFFHNLAPIYIFCHRQKNISLEFYVDDQHKVVHNYKVERKLYIIQHLFFFKTNKTLKSEETFKGMNTFANYCMLVCCIQNDKLWNSSNGVNPFQRTCAGTYPKHYQRKPVSMKDITNWWNPTGWRLAFSKNLHTKGQTYPKHGKTSRLKQKIRSSSHEQERKV